MADTPQFSEATDTIDPTASGTEDDKTKTTGETPEKYADWEALVKAHPEASELYDGKTSGLKSALDKERDKATDAAKALRALAKEADEKTASALAKQATEMEAAVEDARRESTFYREAAAAGIPGERLARAWLMCKNGDFTTKRGDPDLAAMKTELPELFTQPAAPAPRINAGAGTQQAPAAAHDFNENIRSHLRST